MNVTGRLHTVAEGRQVGPGQYITGPLFPSLQTWSSLYWKNVNIQKNGKTIHMFGDCLPHNSFQPWGVSNLYLESALHQPNRNLVSTFEVIGGHLKDGMAKVKYTPHSA